MSKEENELVANLKFLDKIILSIDQHKSWLINKHFEQQEYIESILSLCRTGK